MASQDPKTETPETDASSEDALVEKLMQKLAPMITGAVKSHIKKSLPDFDTLISERLQTPKVEAPAGQPNPLEAELKKLAARLEKSESARKQTERKAAEDRAYTGMVNELTRSGKFRQEAVPVVADLLRARGVLHVDDDGNHTYRHDDQDFPLSEGVNHFMKSKEASLFLAAPSGQAKPQPQVRAPFAPAPQASPVQSGSQLQGSPEDRAAARLAEMGIDMRSVLTQS